MLFVSKALSAAISTDTLHGTVKKKNSQLGQNHLGKNEDFLKDNYNVLQFLSSFTAQYIMVGKLDVTVRSVSSSVYVKEEGMSHYYPDATKRNL